MKRARRDAPQLPVVGGSGSGSGSGSGGGGGGKSARVLDVPGFRSGRGDDSSHRRVVMVSEDLLELRRLYLNESTIRACARILESTVMASGLQLTRRGELVKLQPSFRRHLDEHWLPFARDVIASVLVTGLCPVILVPKPTPAFGRPPPPNDDKNLCPAVLDLTLGQVVIEQHELTRTFLLETPSGDPIAQSHVFVKNLPDAQGRPDSAMAALREPLLFQQELRTAAIAAEKVRSRLLILTNILPRTGKGNENLDDANMFFDEESRAIASDNQRRDEAKHHTNLVLASRLAAQLNAVQTTRGGGGDAGGLGGSGRGAVADGKLLSATEPSPVPPALFVAPSGQAVAPAPRAPEARGDLDRLEHALGQKIAVALGVPPLMVSDGARFSSSSSAQMQSFNTFCADLASFVSAVLTQTYVAIYGGSDDDRLVMRALNVQSFDELVKVHAAGLVPTEHISPLVMSSLGFSKEEQDNALKTLAQREQQQQQQATGDAVAGTGASAAAAPASNASVASSDAGGDA